MDSEQNSRDGPVYVLAVTKLTIPEPSPTESSGVITYAPTAPITMSPTCGAQPNGANGGVGHDDGYDGGNGAPAVNAVPRSQAKVYVIVGDLSTSGGNPKAPRLVDLSFNGLPGDNGSSGCRGGNGGNGSDRGSFNGPGDAGKAGTGSRGGDAAPGQAGAQFSWFITPNVEPNVGRLLVSVEGGPQGRPGDGGPCGAIGKAGSGNWTGGGGSAKGKDCVGPNPAPSGNLAQPGPYGTVTTNVGNYLPNLPFDKTVRLKKSHSKPKQSRPVPPPPPAPE